MENMIIDTPERIENDMEDFKIDAVEAEKNFTATRIKLCREGESNKPVLFYSQELNRNFKRPGDIFAKRHIIKTFTPSNIEAVTDTTLSNKYHDTLLAHKDSIWDYSPLTDIHSEKMNLFVDEDTATFLSDVGINVDGLGEDFQSIESVESTPFLEEVSLDATRLKTEYDDLNRKLLTIKEQMVDEFMQWVSPRSLTDEEFDLKLSQEKVPDALIQEYLSLKEQLGTLKARLGLVKETVFTETRSKIQLPKLIEERSLHDLFKI